VTPAAPGLRAAPGPADPRGVAAAVAGAITIAFSAILVHLADVAPATAAVFRCAYALPALGALAWWERRRFGPRPAREVRLAAVAGVLFAADLLTWHQAIADVGAGLATVLGNLQVLLVPLIAWAALGERPGGRVLAALPAALMGIVLIAGVLEDGAYGARPVRGVLLGVLTGVSYAGFILLLRAGGTDSRRPAGPLMEATAVAAAASAVAGALAGDVDLMPAWPSHGWLVTLALSSQVIGWLLISAALARLPAASTSVLLTLQPAGSVLLGVVLLAERPTALQLAGVALILAGLLALAAASRRPGRLGPGRQRGEKVLPEAARRSSTGS
jgi:drug/metabolite transporter (DMT)-like permease